MSSDEWGLGDGTRSARASSFFSVKLLQVDPLSLLCIFFCSYFFPIHFPPIHFFSFDWVGLGWVGLGWGSLFFCWPMGKENDHTITQDGAPR